MVCEKCWHYYEGERLGNTKPCPYCGASNYDYDYEIIYGHKKDEYKGHGTIDNIWGKVVDLL